ncbi:outer membrane lipoprotein-sorting protein [Archangium gephyra]|uniref:outer membrane lipoprotein-sorting protein n=1 Tax=Archangium gephyra TaxID=48 RepID=UPI003B760749
MNPRAARLPSLLLALLVSLPALAAEPPLSATELVRRIDKRMSLQSDYKGTVRILERRKNGVENAYEIVVYRRDSTRDLLFMTTKPKILNGSGYLRIGKNLWEYDPTVGQWTRTTVRANISGTFTCEADFDRSRLSEDYDAKDEGEETIDGTKYRKIFLSLKPGVEQPFPLLRIWVDSDLNIVKRVGYAPSGRTLRSDYIRSYQRLKDPVSGEIVYHYKEVLEVEEEEGTQMLLKYDEVVLQPLSPNMFTKSFLEQRAR